MYDTEKITHILSDRNVVAACRQCNIRKGSSEFKDYLRTLYRDGFLSPGDFEDRLSHLELLSNGKLKPQMKTTKKANSADAVD